MTAGPGTSYSNVHRRISKLRGAAALHLCIDCGHAAADWSYDGTDPDERTGRVFSRGEWREFTYSLDASRYVPRCRRCHRDHDSALRQSSHRRILAALTAGPVTAQTIAVALELPLPSTRATLSRLVSTGRATRTAPNRYARIGATS